MTNFVRYTQLVEGNKRQLKQHEMKARSFCGHIAQDKGPSVKIIEFFDEQIKKYEFQLGITPALLDESLVRENQKHQEEQSIIRNNERFNHKRPDEIDANIDFLDLGTKAGPDANASLANFQPQGINNFGNNMTIDQNQTIKLGGVGDKSIRMGGMNQDEKSLFVAQNADDTVGGLMAVMTK